MAAETACGVMVQVLGPCRLTGVASASADEFAELTVLQRRLLGRLAMSAGREVSGLALLDALWPEDQPRTARAALQNQVSRIRSLVDGDVLATTANGYVLLAVTDADVMAADVDAAERALLADEPARARQLADDALARWRGEPFGELDHLSEAQAHRQRLEILRNGVETIRLAAALRTGATVWAVPEGERLVAESPFDERRWVLLVEALELAGRRGDALGAFDRARRTLREGLGLQPGPALRAAEASVLGVDAAEHSGTFIRLVGRDVEVAAVLAVVSDRGSVLITGEAGSGRTSLLTEVAGRVRRSGARVARVRCLSDPATATVSLVELLTQLGEQLDRVGPLVESFAGAVARAAAEQPVVLVVDDLNLAGPTTKRAIDACSSLVDVSVVASVGDAVGALAGADDVLDGERLATVALAPLDRAALADLAADLTDDPGALEGAFVDWLAVMSGGNPMFVECLLADPTVRDWWTSDPCVGPTDNASVLRDVVRRRLDRLSAPTGAAIEIAAICGPELPASLLDALAPPAGVRDAMAEGLLRPSAEGRVRFRHGAVQRVVYDDIAPGRRMEIHHAAALALHGTGEPAAVVARHHLASLELDPLAATTSARQAAVDAGQHGAHGDAARWYERAIDAARTMGEPGIRPTVEALIGLGDALRLAGDGDDEDVLFEAADLATAIDDPALLGDAAFALLQLGGTSESGALHERAIALADRAMAAAEDPEGRAVVAAAASLAHSMGGQTDRCRTLFLEAEAAAQSDEARRKVLPFAFLGLGLPGDLARREELQRELRQRAAAADDPVALFEALHLAFSAGLQRGDGDQVRAAHLAMEELYPRVGDIGRRWALGYQRAALAHLDDDLEASERHAEETLEVFASVAPSRAFAVYGGQLLVIRLAQGRISELADVMERLVTDQPGVPAWRAALALAVADVDPERAAVHAAAALDDVPFDFTWMAAHMIGGRAAAIAGDEATRAEYVRRLEPWADRICWQGTCAYGPVATTLAALARARGDDATCDGRAEAARKLAASLGAPVFTREVDGLLE